MYTIFSYTEGKRESYPWICQLAFSSSTLLNESLGGLYPWFSLTSCNLFEWATRAETFVWSADIELCVSAFKCEEFSTLLNKSFSKPRGKMSSVRTTTSVRLISLLLFLSQQLTPVLNTENSCFFGEHRIIQKGVSNSEVALRLSFGRCSLKCKLIMLMAITQSLFCKS